MSNSTIIIESDGLITTHGSNLTLEVYNRIKNLMLDYEIIPGQRLVFSDIARNLGVSRTPINNALYMLAKEGYLDFIPNRGYTVHRLTREEADELYNLLKIISVGAISEAIQRVTPEKIARVKKCEDVYEKELSKEVFRRRFLLDQEFHASILAMSDNKQTVRYFREIYQLLFLRHPIRPLRQERTKEILLEHNQLFEAVKIRNLQRAKELVAHHINAGQKYIYSYIF